MLTSPTAWPKPPLLLDPGLYGVPSVGVCQWPAVMILRIPSSSAAVWDVRLHLKIVKNPQPVPDKSWCHIYKELKILPVSGHAGTKSWDLPVPIQL